jgi:hypothetical protein
MGKTIKRTPTKSKAHKSKRFLSEKALNKEAKRELKNYKF